MLNNFIVNMRLFNENCLHEWLIKDEKYIVTDIDI